MSGSPFAAAGAKVVPVVAVLALAAGVVAFVEQRVEAAQPAAPVARADLASAVPDLASSSLAADAGLRVVAAWGSSTRDSATTLESFGLDLPAAPKTGLALSGLRVATVSTVGGDPSLYQVLVAATVGKRGQYFSVPVQVTSGAATVLGLPAPAPQPPITSDARLAYRNTDVSASSPVVGAVTGFLTAYLAGLDITRYTAPGAQLTPVTGSVLPLEQVLRVDATADSDLLDEPNPAEGSRTAVLVTFTTRSAAGPVSSQLCLNLAARADRWEVVSIDPVPQLETAVVPAPLTSVPSGAATGGTGATNTPTSPDASASATPAPTP
ncbi:MAG: conjugal transfer protein [Humibacillus sp.]|nr:conjugal transfer protein [Humibacillus sp.]